MNMLATRFNYRNVNVTPGNGRTALCSVAERLTEDQLRQFVPSIFAETAHASRSDRYLYIPTIEVVRGLIGQGFSPVFACEAKARDESKVGFTKHMVRFRQEGAVAVAGAVPELIMVNSHDGSTRYQFMAGMFRFVCANGSIVGTRYADVGVRHTGTVVDEAIEGAFTVAREFEKVTAAASQMQAITLQRDHSAAFADAALAVKYFDEEKGEVDAPIQPAQLLIPRRHEDGANDLWTTYNVVQENLIRGGLRGKRKDANGRTKRSTTRAVNGIDGNVKLNRGLWTLAEKMAEIMGQKIAA